MLSLSSARCASKPVAARARLPLLPGRGKLVAPTLKQQRLHACSDDAGGSAADDAVQQASSTGAAVIAAQPQRSDEGLYLDPLVRSLLLGVGAGIACEAMHVVVKVSSSTGGSAGRRRLHGVFLPRAIRTCSRLRLA